jgi:hypothetical protein
MRVWEAQGEKVKDIPGGRYRVGKEAELPGVSRMNSVNRAFPGRDSVLSAKSRFLTSFGMTNNFVRETGVENRPEENAPSSYKH